MTRIDRAERWINAPPARLFAGWTDPALLIRWLPPGDMSGKVEQFEARPGGLFRLFLSYSDTSVPGKSGGGQDVVEGQFLVLDPPRHLAFVSRFESDDPDLRGEMRMDWHFDAENSGTRLRIEARAVPVGISAEDHQAGMDSSLAQLAALVE